jgi:hypothetical protein
MDVYIIMSILVFSKFIKCMQFVKTSENRMIPFSLN